MHLRADQQATSRHDTLRGPAIGFGYIAAAPTGAAFDCYADLRRTRWSLGDGWYWLDRI